MVRVGPVGRSLYMVAQDLYHDHIFPRLAWPTPALAANATQRAAVWGVGVHYPGAASPLEAQSLGLPLWASEDDSSGGLNGGACLARAINENYVNGQSEVAWNAADIFKSCSLRRL